MTGTRLVEMPIVRQAGEMLAILAAPHQSRQEDDVGRKSFSDVKQSKEESQVASPSPEPDQIREPAVEAGAQSDGGQQSLLGDSAAIADEDPPEGDLVRLFSSFVSI